MSSQAESVALAGQAGLPARLAILIIPIFELFSDLGWLSILPCALFLAVTMLPFEIYLIKNFIDAVPQDLEEAARMERAGTMQILLKVIGPLAMPGIADLPPLRHLLAAVPRRVRAQRGGQRLGGAAPPHRRQE
jgi:ABC-type sugar transport system permease subunit